jgi:glycosyltransferase involved in cell wall biosynthesis
MTSNGGGRLQERVSKVCFVGTYPPRECGIATFTSDLRRAVGECDGGVQTVVVAVTKTRNDGERPPEVVFEIRQERLHDYRLAAEYINFSGAGLVCLQHEFGIFGGADGGHVTELLRHLRLPVVTTLHTVVGEPPCGLRDTLVRVASASDHLVVLNSRAVPLLSDVYAIPSDKVSLIHHGVPDVPFLDPNYYKDKFGVEGRLVMLTFGLLSRNKGIETTLEALPQIVRAHPEVVYLVLGATHPEVKRRDGEEYRRFLQQRVHDLGLEAHVRFHDRYVSFDELCEFIGACDIYVTTYRAKEQIVSGTLAYAVGMGKAVVSTPYLYAEELLASGRGRLTCFGDAHQLARAINELIVGEAARHRMRKRAYEFGRRMTWPEVGKEYAALFERVASRYQSAARLRKARVVGAELPAIKLDHLVMLTDDTGVIQHATYGVPDRRHGYSTDDAARALVAVLAHYRQFGDAPAPALATKYLSFLRHAQLPSGHFHNFMRYDRRFNDEDGGEDTLGRALWGLGVAVSYGHNEGARALAREMFERALGALDLRHPHAAAYAVCGLHAFLKRYDGATRVRQKLRELADCLASLYEQNRREDWRWFWDTLTYGNAKLPQAMLLAHEATGEGRFLKAGLESLDFLLAETYREGRFDFVGNRGWYRRGGERAVFGQQSIEAGYTAEACSTAYEVTGERRYLELASAAVEWLLGRNRLRAPLYDPATGACADGLDAHGPSMNQGAESVICCVLGLLSVSRWGEATVLKESALVAAANAIKPAGIVEGVRGQDRTEVTDVAGEAANSTLARAR